MVTGREIVIMTVMIDMTSSPSALTVAQFNYYIVLTAELLCREPLWILLL